jgi:serine/threonine-protein kinase
MVVDVTDRAPTAATGENLVGSTVAGKYRVSRLLGAGGMGAVYEAEHVELGKRVAIKVIRPTFAASEEISERFRREARAASLVESDGIVQVFDVGQDAAAGLYMVMELLQGEDLSVRLAREPRLPAPLAVGIAIQAARALAKAHAAGVIHRDLKPANLFLVEAEDGSLRVKVLDFGISKLTRDQPEASGNGALTRTGAVLGTAQYMSPEQAQGLPVDARTDVWSLGAVLFEALAGRSAFRDMDTYEQTIIQIVTTSPSPLRVVAPWVDPGVAAVVDAALSPGIDDRIRDCAALVERLLATVDRRPEATADVVNPGHAPSTEGGRGSTGDGMAAPAAPARRAPRMVMGLGLLLAAGVAAAFFVVRSQTRTIPPAYGIAQPATAPAELLAGAQPSPATARPIPAKAETPPLAGEGGAPPPIASALAGAPGHARPGTKRTLEVMPPDVRSVPAPSSRGQIGGLGATTEY